MNKGQSPRQRLQRQRCLGCQIAVAGHHHILTTKIIRPLQGIEKAHALAFVHTGNRWPPRLECPATCGDHHRARIEDVSLVREKAETAVSPLLKPADSLIEGELRFEWCDLLHQPIDQKLRVDDGMGGDVVDGLVSIELRTLPARAVQAVDQMALQAVKTKFEGSKEPNRPRADNRDIDRSRLPWSRGQFQPCLSGTATTSPSMSSETLI